MRKQTLWDKNISAGTFLGTLDISRIMKQEVKKWLYSGVWGVILPPKLIENKVRKVTQYIGENILRKGVGQGVTSITI